jgi:glycosyltransferase involved in cell wall biosynthesis
MPVADEDYPMKIFLLHNIAAPYRLPLFERLADEFDLTVGFCKKNKGFREWNPDLRSCRFEWSVLNGIQLGSIIINYGIIKHLLMNEYDVFIVGDNENHLFATMCVYLFAKIFGRPFILWSGQTDIQITQHTDPQSYHRRVAGDAADIIGEAYRRLLYSGSDAIVAYSTLTKRHLTKRGVKSDRIFVGGQVMPGECLQSVVGDMDGTGDSFVVTYLGYLQERKGVQFLIEAYRSLNNSNIKLQIAGSGPYENQLRALAEGDDGIEFLGYVDGEAKAKCYTETDLFVLPTLRDSWGLVVNEALHYDTPVIVTEAAGSADFVQANDCGVVVPPGEADALENAMRRLYTDEEEWQRLQDNARKCNKGTEVDEGIKPFHRAISYIRR